MKGGHALDDDIIAVIGEADYLRLAEALGGAQLWLKASYGPDDLVTRAIGPEQAARFAELFYGYRITLPLARTRRRLIRRLAADGCGGDEIARRLKCSRALVYKVLGTPDDTRQGRLFDAA